MGQHLLKLRIRPARVLVLINRDASESDLLLAIEFFSKIWGGRYGQILTVDPNASDPLTEYRLGNSRPEFIYGIGLDDEYWNAATRRACQPRGYGKLCLEFVRNLKQHHFEDYYLADHALIHLWQTRDQRKTHKQALRLVTPEIGSKLSTYCAAMFGIHNDKLRGDMFDIECLFEGTAVDLIELAAVFVKSWQQSWLDVTCHKLIPQFIGHFAIWGHSVPTVVLVANLVQDMSLFWNLRSASDTRHPTWFIPILFDGGVTDPRIFEMLKDWLLAFNQYDTHSNYCHITSQTVGEADCRLFAEQLRLALVGTPIENVDFEAPRNWIPVVVPYEYETIWPVELDGQKLTIIPPEPKAFEGQGRPRSWIIDLLKDMKTGRDLMELRVPPNLVVFDLLNGMCPPRIEHSRIPRTGDGCESINLRCSGSNEVIDVYLPHSKEILEEILREHGIEPIRDEKRSSYDPVIKRFGELSLAATDFSGQSGIILNSLVNETMTLDQIKSRCKLGGKDVDGKTHLQRIEPYIQNQSERMKRISRQRYRDHLKTSLPENLKLRTLLEHWIDRGILNRQWKITCCECSQQYFVPSLNIQKRVICLHCGHRISLPSQVPIGYTLDRAVAHAIKEGIVPVVQTGRFLQGLSYHGFFWLPGVKFNIGTELGDLDILACCDGHLIFCECKNLEETPSDSKVWDEVATQFIETARIAKKCKASLSILASRAIDYPQSVQDRLKDELKESIPYLLLNREDLEKGYRPCKDNNFTLDDLLPSPFPETPRVKSETDSGNPRTIQFGVHKQ